MTADPPDVTAARDHVRDELVWFVRALRRAGVDVPANAATTAGRALVVVGFEDEPRVRAALRACLVSDRRDVDAFDRLFAEFWRRLDAGLDADGPADQFADPPAGGLAPTGDPAPGEDASGAEARERDDGHGESGGEDGRREAAAREQSLGAVVARNAADHAGVATAGRQSPTGSPEPVDAPVARGGTDGDAVELARAFDALTAALGGLRGRRWTARESGRAAVRRALRESVTTGGTVTEVPERGRTRPDVRAVVLADVSQSVLDTVDRGFLLSFLRRARRDWRDARVFFFDESLREVTDAFDAPTTTAAADALARAETEWGGGTRIGASLAALPTDAVVDHRTVVFVVSDGLETGDVAVLERELAAVSRRAEAVVWLNPLAASPAFEPAARGMAAALPFVDGVFAFADASDVAELARQLDRRGAAGRVGHEYDPRKP